MSQIFQEVVQRDAAWQRAVDRVSHQEPDAASRFKWRGEDFYHFNGFPELLRAVCEGDPNVRVRCNFDPGSPRDDAQVDEILDANMDSDIDTWFENWRRKGVTYKTLPPMPNFHTLKEEYVFPDAWIERFWEEEEDV